MSYSINTLDTAPAAARDFLTGINKTFGFVPNIMGVMSDAPPLVKAYGMMSQMFDETSFSPTERMVVILASSAENGCEYCVSAHSAQAEMMKLPSDIVNAIRIGTPISDPKLEALRRFTTLMVTKRGWASETDIKDFLATGYTEANVLEVILGIGYKMLSNYTTHVAKPPLDSVFTAAAWRKAG